jgi:prepilin-type N-terminal cleavage/methylation domain-containing protein
MNRRIHPNQNGGFTLIELLVVVAILAILAGLILATAGHAMSLARRSRVEAERQTLVTALQSYKASKGFYPQDNPTDPTHTQVPLFYELTGTIISPATGAPANYFAPANGDNFNTNNIVTAFGTMGFVNSSLDASQVVNFFPSTAKSARTGRVITGGVTNTLFGVPVPGPIQLPVVSGGTINPWCYVSTNPTNNSATYDLWMDVYYSGHTNRVNNWSQNPLVL